MSLAPDAAWLITGCSTGLAALVRRMLPGMRARGRGHVVNVSSIAGLTAMPGGGYYAATKFAVEALSEALWKEVQPLGLRVTLIEPGPFRTDFAGRSIRFPRQPIDAYAATAGARNSIATPASSPATRSVPRRRSSRSSRATMRRCA